ncbi:MAG TPA: hypothetical protein PKM14_09055, partial [Limnochordia bacterium]|nr:hypothetical protein [Limnochordia bacterium]HQE37132.1 hypothetical protein [Limnochordia bacterium]
GKAYAHIFFIHVGHGHNLFLGLGVPLQIPTWGNILNAAQDLTILQEAWWIWVPVGLVISAFVLSINFIGDGLRDAVDPTQQG